MLFADLTDIDFSFRCCNAQDACELWDYELTVKEWDDMHYQNLSKKQVCHLRKNCLRILKAIEGFQGGI